MYEDKLKEIQQNLIIQSTQSMYVCKMQVEVCSCKLGDNTKLGLSARQTQHTAESHKTTIR